MRFGSLLALREVDVGSDLDAGIARADDRREDVFNALDDARLDFLDVFDLGRIEAGFQELAFHLRQQRAVLIEQSDAGCSQLRHTGGNEILDAGDLGRVQRASRVEIEQHRG